MDMPAALPFWLLPNAQAIKRTASNLSSKCLELSCCERHGCGRQLWAVGLMTKKAVKMSTFDRAHHWPSFMLMALNIVTNATSQIHQYGTFVRPLLAIAAWAAVDRAIRQPLASTDARWIALRSRPLSSGSCTGESFNAWTAYGMCQFTLFQSHEGPLVRGLP